MAESISKKPKVLPSLKCSICVSTFSTPKLLHCFHSFCQGCISKLAGKDKQGRPAIACPTCKQVTPFPGGRVEDLHPAFHIIGHLRDADPNWKGQVDEPTDLHVCPDHSEDMAKLYCETCGFLICYKCISKGGKHNGHNYDLLGRAFEKYKEEIGSAIGPMEEQVEYVKKALEQLDSTCSDVVGQEESTESKISAAMGQIHKVLDMRKAELLRQLDEMTERKLSTLHAQKMKLESTHNQLVGAMDFIWKSANAGEEGLMVRANTSLDPEVLKASVEEGAVVFVDAPDNVTAALESFGELSTPPAAPAAAVDGKKARAVRDHKAGGEDEISFSAGETIENIELVNEKWLSGECKGRRGLFLFSSVEII